MANSLSARARVRKKHAAKKAHPKHHVAKKKLGKKAKKKAKRTKKVSYLPGHYTASPVLTGVHHTIASRFSYGITPALAREVAAAGGGLGWFEQQVRSAYDGRQNVAPTWWPELSAAPTSALMQKLDADGFSMIYPNWMIARRIYSPRQLLERVTEFWESHLHVPARPDSQFRYRADYGRMIRTRALGKFSDLLLAATQHPAMQIYLSGNGSTASHPNENLGRELLELHTVGVGNYTEDDVKNAARVLTGFVIDTSARTAPTYRAENHWVGAVTVMSSRQNWPAPFTAANAAGTDGPAVLAAMVTYLARHPATAKRIAQKLATTFVSDTPPAALVNQLASVYLANDTAIVPVLRALIRSPYFTQSDSKKLRDPAADLVATHRVLGSQFRPPTNWGSAANQVFWQLNKIGAAPFWWMTPDGPPQTATAWATPVRALVSADVHYSAAGQWYPAQDITYRDSRTFMPVKKLSFRNWVDHLSRVLLGKPSTTTLLKACCATTGLKPDAVVKRSGDWPGGRFPDLLVTILDSPSHYYY